MLWNEYSLSSILSLSSARALWILKGACRVRMEESLVYRSAQVYMLTAKYVFLHTSIRIKVEYRYMFCYFYACARKDIWGENFNKGMTATIVLSTINKILLMWFRDDSPKSDSWRYLSFLIRINDRDMHSLWYRQKIPRRKIRLFVFVDVDRPLSHPNTNLYRTWCVESRA